MSQTYQRIYRFAGLPVSQAVTVWNSAGAVAGTGTTDEFGALEIELTTGRYFANNAAGTVAVEPVAQYEPGIGSGANIADGSVTGGTAGAGVKIAATTITNANISASAAIVESKLSLASDAAAGTASRRTLGTGAAQAAPGNDARFLAVGTTIGTVAAGNDARFLAVGTTTGTVAAGNDARFLAVGTTTGTVAAGDDARITGVAGWFKIGEVSLASPAASIAFSSIPATYRHLRVVASLRSDRAGNATDNPVMTINGDTADANYDRQRLTASGSSVTGSEILGAAGSRTLNTIPAATATANNFGVHDLTLSNYADTARNKLIRGESFSWAARSTGGLNLGQIALGWASTAAINAITFTPSLGTNLDTGSRVSLYGINAAA